MIDNRHHPHLPTAPGENAPEAYFTLELQADIYKRAAERMRHRVFVQELGWVGTNKACVETDDYDSTSNHFGVLRNQDVIGHMRLTRRPNPFMLEKEFLRLLPDGYRLEAGQEVAEISRLCIAAEFRSKRLVWENRRVFVSELLYAFLWKWCQGSGVAVLYFVTTPSIARLLRLQGFPCRMINQPNKELGAVACRLAWREYAGNGRLAGNTLIHKPLSMATAIA